MLGIVISTRQRVFGLDLLRAFAIFCVVHRHGKHLIYGTKLDWLANFSLPHGVDLFFVLSGFLIGLSVINMTEQLAMGRHTWQVGLMNPPQLLCTPFVQPVGSALWLP